MDKCCAVLYNLLHTCDELGKWESGVKWGKEDRYFVDARANWAIQKVNGFSVSRDADYSTFGSQEINGNEVYTMGLDHDFNLFDITIFFYNLVIKDAYNIL